MTRLPEITIVTCNFEMNGGGDQKRWLRMHERLAKLRPSVLLRQEMFNVDSKGHGSALLHASERVLGMVGTLGPGLETTALYHDPAVFEPDVTWDTHWPAWWLHPTARTLRLRGTALPLLLGSFHMTYNSPAARELEALDLTRLNDKRSTSGKPVRCILGGDTNSYPQPTGIEGEPSLPDLEQVKDLPHRAHRFRKGPDGGLLPDTLPDEILRTAGLEDPARHLATATGFPAALAPTMDASETHGPATRVDRFYLSRELLDAVTDLEIIHMNGLSDHHTLRLRLGRHVLEDILSAPAGER